MTMAFTDKDKAMAQFDSMRETFHLLMGAKQRELETPVVIEAGFNGAEPDARESARLVADAVESEGYDVDINYIEETTSHDGGERHRFSIRTTGEPN